MPNHLRSDGSLDETLRVVGAWMCACGEHLAWDEEHRRPAGTTSVATLHTLAHSASARQHTCSARAWEGSGQTISLIRIPHGPVVATVLRARRDIGRFADHCIAADEDRALAWDGRTLPAGTDDYELARRTGRPLNIVAAWHDALMHVRVGAPAAAFACGPGLVCIWARNRAHAQRAGVRINPAAGEVHRLTNPNGPARPPEWIRGSHHDGHAMWVAIDRDGLRAELRDEAHACGLGWESRGDGAALMGAGGHARAFTPDDLILPSLAAGRDPLREATRHYLTVRRAIRTWT